MSYYEGHTSSAVMDVLQQGYSGAGGVGDDRKRSYESGEEAPTGIGGQPKRSRPEDANFGVRVDDPTKATTRMMLTRNQFSRVIGKAGTTIAHIRSASNVHIRGTDITEEQRLVFLHGTLEQVLSAFDMISEYLQQAASSEGQQVPRGYEIIHVTFLIDHNKVGKLIGPKGATIQNIKMKSGALTVRMDKDLEEILGVNLRRLNVEGTLTSIRRLHLMLQENFVDPAVFNAHAYGQGSGLGLSSGFGGGFEQPATLHPPSEVFQRAAPVPFPTLVNFGVQSETVRQLTDMKAYLWRHFGLELCINREITPAPGHVVPSGSMSREAYGGGYAQAGNRSGVVVPQAPPVNKRPSNPGDVTFTIPKSCVGAVIGKGGQNLKDLVAQYSVRVYIDKEDVGGKRSVTLSFSGGEGCQFTEAEALSICQGKIEGVVQEQLLHQQQQMQMQAGAQHEEGAFSNQEQPPQT